MSSAPDPRLAGRVAFQYPDFTLYAVARFFIVAALEMQSVAIGWQIYDITKQPLDLGLVGLAQFLPGVAFFLAAGHSADRFDRRRLLIWCYVGFAVCSAMLLLFAVQGIRSPHPIYVVAVLLGTVRCFNFPASRALLPQLVPEAHFSNAVAWNSSVFQAATILGPTFGGLVYALFHGPAAVYASAILVALGSVVAMIKIQA